MSKFYKRLVQPGRPTDPTLTGAPGLWNIRDHRLAQASGIWPNGVIPIINYMIVGGGGGGGYGGLAYVNPSGFGGGGGAGGLVISSITPVNITSVMQITIGSGGVGATSVQSDSQNGSDTTITLNSVIKSIAYGGGAGGTNAQASGTITNRLNGSNGGSGGGAGGYQLFGAGPGGNATQPTSIYGGYGNSGGSNPPGGGAGSGGGAGGAGIYNYPVIAGAGLSVNIANNSSYTATYATGGVPTGAAGSANTGNGGGGGSQGQLTGKSGGSGVAIVWWPATYIRPSIVTGTYTTVIENGYRIYKFTGNGTITF